MYSVQHSEGSKGSEGSGPAMTSPATVGKDSHAINLSRMRLQIVIGERCCHRMKMIEAKILLAPNELRPPLKPIFFRYTSM